MSLYRRALKGFMVLLGTICADVYALPGAFGNIAPSNFSMDVDVFPRIYWQEATDTVPVTYTIQIGTDPNFVSGTYTEVSGLSSPEYYPNPDLRKNTLYMWRVLAVNSHGDTVLSNDWASPWAFQSILTTQPIEVSASAPLAANRTLIQANTPYYILGDLEVSAGNRLEIEAGVQVKFQDASSGLLIHGEIRAQGSLQDSIFFECSDSAQSLACWKGVKLTATADSTVLISPKVYGSGSVFEYVSMRAAGASGRSALDSDVPLWVNQSRFSNNGANGLSVRSGGGQFDDLQTRSNGGIGILGGRLMENIVSSNNGGGGAYNTQDSGKLSWINVVSNSNGHTGIVIHGPSHATLTNVRADSNGGSGAEFTLQNLSLTNFSTSGNSSHGQTLSLSGAATIQEDTSNGNGGHGILFADSSNDASLSLTHTYATSNHEFNLKVVSAGEVSIEQGDFSSSETGFGMKISSLGDVKISHVVASTNLDSSLGENEVFHEKGSMVGWSSSPRGYSDADKVSAPPGGPPLLIEIFEDPVYSPTYDFFVEKISFWGHKATSSYATRRRGDVYYRQKGSDNWYFADSTTFGSVYSWSKTTMSFPYGVEQVYFISAYPWEIDEISFYAQAPVQQGSGYGIHVEGLGHSSKKLLLDHVNASGNHFFNLLTSGEMDIDIKSSEFNGNLAEKGYGASFQSTGRLNILQSHFEKNNATGAILDSNLTGGSISLSQFNENHGAGLMVSANDFFIEKSRISKNLDSSDGSSAFAFSEDAVGGVSLLGNRVHLHEDTILSNRIVRIWNFDTKTNYQAAGVKIAGLNDTLSDCVIENNSLELNNSRAEISSQAQGGGVAVLDVAQGTVITGNSIRKNTLKAESSSYGAGIWVQSQNSGLVIRHNTVDSNVVKGFGGGLYVNSVGARIDSNIIINNSASENGGGIWTKSSIVASSISGNHAGQGAGVWVDTAIAEICGNTLTSNVSDSNGAAVHSTDHIQLVKNNIITYNNGPTGGIFGHVDTLQYNNIYNNTGFAYRNRNSKATDATYNWWGTRSDQVEIGRSIEDGVDQPSVLGVATYQPFLTNPSDSVFGPLSILKNVYFTNRDFSVPHVTLFRENDTTFIELIGKDDNPYSKDMTAIFMRNTASGFFISPLLEETSENSGVFRGFARLGSTTHFNDFTLAAANGDSLTIWGLVDVDLVAWAKVGNPVGGNTAPVITSADTISTIEGVFFEYVASATDAESVPVLYTHQLPAWLTFSGDTVRGSVPNGITESGFLLTAEDGMNVSSQWVVIHTTPVNNAPEILSPDTIQMYENSMLRFKALVRDVDSETKLSYEHLPSWLSVVQDSLVGFADGLAEDTSFVVIATDGEKSDTLQITINILNYMITEYRTGFQNVQMGFARWGDYDNDGDLDVLIGGDSNASQGFTQLYNNDAGHFTKVATPFDQVWKSDAEWGDFDHDGDLDLALMGGVTGTTYSTALYENKGKGLFVESLYPLPDLGLGSLAWADVDRDGDLDLAITGADLQNDLYYTKVFRGLDGDSGEIAFSLPGLYNSDLAWGDYMNRGELNLLMQGSKPSSTPRYYGAIYGNVAKASGLYLSGIASLAGGQVGWGDYDADGYLDVVSTGTNSRALTVFSVNNHDYSMTFKFYDFFEQLKESSADFGDYNNDGYLDLLLTGMTDSNSIMSLLYFNDQAGGFILDTLSPNLVQVRAGDAEFADFDNDGDLDFILLGNTQATGSNHLKTALYENKISDSVGVNQPPSAPSSLGSLVDSNGSVTLSWSPSTDDRTPSAGLSYNIWVRQKGAATYVQSPMSDSATGWRMIPALGNVQMNQSWSLQGLQDGLYEWSVQAIDNSYAGGPFASTQSFTIGTPMSSSSSEVSSSSFSQTASSSSSSAKPSSSSSQTASSSSSSAKPSSSSSQTASSSSSSVKPSSSSSQAASSSSSSVKPSSSSSQAASSSSSSVKPSSSSSQAASSSSSSAKPSSSSSQAASSSSSSAKPSSSSSQGSVLLSDLEFNPERKPVRYQIYDFFGRLLMTGIREGSLSASEIRLQYREQISALPRGVYLLKESVDGRSRSFHWVR